MVSPLAQVHQKAQIGPNVHIEPFAIVHEDVVLEEGVHIYSGAQIFPRCISFALHVVTGGGQLDDRQIADGISLRTARLVHAVHRMGKSRLFCNALGCTFLDCCA